MRREIFVAVFCTVTGIQGASGHPQSELQLLWVDIDQNGSHDLIRYIEGGPAQFLLNDGTDRFEPVSEDFAATAESLNQAMVFQLHADSRPALALATPQETVILELAGGIPRVIGRLPGAMRLSSCDYDQDSRTDLILDGQVFAQRPGGGFQELVMPQFPECGPMHAAEESSREASQEKWNKEALAPARGSDPTMEAVQDSEWAEVADRSAKPGDRGPETGADGPMGQGPTVRGNVGINMPSPLTELHIGRNPDSSDRNSRVWIANEITTSSPEAPAELVLDRRALSPSQLAAVGMDSPDRDFYVWVNGSDRLRVDETGVTRHLNASGEATVVVDPTDAGGTLQVLGTGESPGWTLSARTRPADGGSLAGYNASGRKTVELEAEGGAGDAYLSLIRSGGEASQSVRLGSGTLDQGSSLLLRQARGDLGWISGPRQREGSRGHL